jgi:GNAT superfamily N-acetyltransferase
MLDVKVVRLDSSALHTYADVSIEFEVRSKVRLDVLVESSGMNWIEEPVEPYGKNYDLVLSEHPRSLETRFDTSNWGIFGANLAERQIGGAIVAARSSDFDMLAGRDDLAVLVDLRVQPAFRGQGIGRALFHSAADWAKLQGCQELLVETQDTNVPACRFYSAMGFQLHSIATDGYGPDNPEAKLILRYELQTGPAT